MSPFGVVSGPIQDVLVSGDVLRPDGPEALQVLADYGCKVILEGPAERERGGLGFPWNIEGGAPCYMLRP